jgi:hypothetical protein
MKTRLIVILVIFSAASVRAQPSQPSTEPTATSPMPSAPAAPEVPRSPHERARFSGKRLVLEILGGELTGSIATALTFKGLCDGTDCFGSAIAAFGVNLAVTPLAVWGIGAAMGGEGSLGYTYLGASVALTPFSVTGSADESPADALSRLSIEVWMSSILLAPCSALIYEASSHGRWSREHAINVSLKPIRDRENVSGVAGFVTGRF